MADVDVMKCELRRSARWLPSLINRDSRPAAVRPDPGVMEEAYADPTAAEFVVSVTARIWIGSSGMFIENVLQQGLLLVFHRGTSILNASGT